MFGLKVLMFYLENFKRETFVTESAQFDKILFPPSYDHFLRLCECGMRSRGVCRSFKGTRYAKKQAKTKFLQPRITVVLRVKVLLWSYFPPRQCFREFARLFSQQASLQFSIQFIFIFDDSKITSKWWCPVIQVKCQFIQCTVDLHCKALHHQPKTPSSSLRTGSPRLW